MVQIKRLLRKNPVSSAVLFLWILGGIISFFFSEKSQIIDLENSLLRPCLADHWLGTDDLGRDVAAGILNGSRYAWLIGSCVCILAGFGGLILGAGIAFIERFQHRITIFSASFWLFLIWVGFIIYVKAVTLSFWEKIGIWAGFFIGSIILFSLKKQYHSTIIFLRKEIHFPVNQIFNFFLSLYGAIPALVIALLLSAMIPTGAISVIGILTLVAWVPFARISYFTTLHQLNLPYSEVVQVLGIPNYRFFLVHLLPKIYLQLLTPLIQIFVFSILTEAAISFLGFGLASETVTWGSMLSLARDTPSAWWLAVFPAIALISFAAPVLHIAEYFNAEPE